VVPALEQAQERNTQNTAQTSVSPDASPSMSSDQALQLERSSTSISNPSPSTNVHPRGSSPERHYGPLPIDLTGFHLARRPASELPDIQQRGSERSTFSTSVSMQPIQTSTIYSTGDHNRKRSFSGMEGNLNVDRSPDGRTNRLGSISSILNPTQQDALFPEDFPMRETSKSPGFQPAHLPAAQQRSQRSAPDVSATADISTRKAQLMREAEAMREMLAATERELQELDGEG
jgi:GATA-binding protein